MYTRPPQQPHAAILQCEHIEKNIFGVGLEQFRIDRRQHLTAGYRSSGAIAQRRQMRENDAEYRNYNINTREGPRMLGERGYLLRQGQCRSAVCGTGSASG